MSLSMSRDPIANRSATTRRRWLAGSAAAVGGALAAACGTAPSRSDAPAAPAGPPVNLLYWSQRAPGDRLGNGVKAALDDYVARNPGRVTLEVGEGGAALGMERIKTAIAGGTQPDLYGGLYQSPAVELFALGAVLDLNRELRTDKDWTKSKSELIPSNVDGCSWKGQFVMVPMMLAQQVLGLNRQLMSRAGVPLPAQNFTWNDFVELGRKVVQPGQRWLMSWNYTWSAFNSWIYANGLAPLSTDRTKVLYDTPQMLETLQWLHDLATAGQVFRAGPSTVPEFDGGTFVAESVNEAAAMQPPRYPNVDTGDGAGLFVTHFPIGPSNTKRQIITYANTYGLIALKSSDPRKVATAAAITGWGARAEVQTRIAEASGHPPPNLSAAKDDVLPARIKGNPILNKINEFGKYTYLTPNFPSWVKGMDLLTESFTRVMKGELRPRDALADAQPKIQAFVDEDLKRG